MKFLNLFLNVFTCFSNLGAGPSSRKNKFTNRREPRPNLRAEHKDQQELKKNGVNFRLKFLGAREMKDDDLDAFEGVVREMTDSGRKEYLKERSSEIVMTVAPTRVLVATEEPYTMLHNHLMDSIMNGFVSKDDRKFFMYSVKDLDDDKITCYCFRTQKKMTGLRMIRTFRFAQHCWEAIKQPEHPRVIELRRAYAARLSKPPTSTCAEHLLENTKSTGAGDIQEASAVETYTSASAMVAGIDEEPSLLIRAYSGDDEEDYTKAVQPRSIVVPEYSDEEAVKPKVCPECDRDSDGESLHSADLAKIYSTGYLAQKPPQFLDIDDLRPSRV